MTGPSSIPRVRVLAMIVLVTIGLSAATGCGTSGSSGDRERPLTTREAALLAEVLVKNHRAGGVIFAVTTLDRPGGSTVRLEGRLDWENHVGEANLNVERGNAPTVIGWSRDMVLERWPETDAVLGSMDAPEAPIVVRPPDTSRRLDQIIAVLVGLAGERPDNAQLVLQTEGSAFVREDELRGTPVVVMRYGTRNVYWLHAETGEMVRFEARSEQGDLPIVVDVLGRSTGPIALPDSSSWVPIDSIAGFYSDLSPSV